MSFPTNALFCTLVTIYFPFFRNTIISSISEHSHRYSAFSSFLRQSGSFDVMLSEVNRAFKSCCAIGMTFFGCIAFFRVCYPFSKYRLIVSIGICILTFFVLLGFFLYQTPTITDPNATFGGSFFGFEFHWMKLTSWLWVFHLLLQICTLYLIKSLKKQNLLRKLIILQNSYYEIRIRNQKSFS